MPMLRRGLNNLSLNEFDSLMNAVSSLFPWEMLNVLAPWSIRLSPQWFALCLALDEWYPADVQPQSAVQVQTVK